MSATALLLLGKNFLFTLGKVLSNQYFWMVSGALFVLWLAFDAGRDHVQQKWDTSEAIADAAWAAAEKDMLAKQFIAEIQIAAFKEGLEKINGEKQQANDAILAENRRLARLLGGLRDPGAKPPASPLPAAPGAPSGSGSASCSDRLSEAASGFLLDFARQCDAVADQYDICRAWALKSPALITPGAANGPD